MAGWKELLVDVLKLTDEVKQLNKATDLLSQRTIDIDKRLVRLETIVELSNPQRQLPDPGD